MLWWLQWIGVVMLRMTAPVLHVVLLSVMVLRLLRVVHVQLLLLLLRERVGIVLLLCMHLMMCLMCKHLLLLLSMNVQSSTAATAVGARVRMLLLLRVHLSMADWCECAALPSTHQRVGRVIVVVRCVEGRVRGQKHRREGWRTLACQRRIGAAARMRGLRGAGSRYTARREQGSLLQVKLLLHLRGQQARAVRLLVGVGMAVEDLVLLLLLLRLQVRRVVHRMLLLLCSSMHVVLLLRRQSLLLLHLHNRHLHRMLRSRPQRRQMRRRSWRRARRQRDRRAAEVAAGHRGARGRDRHEVAAGAAQTAATGVGVRMVRRMMNTSSVMVNMVRAVASVLTHQRRVRARVVLLLLLVLQLLWILLVGHASRARGRRVRVTFLAWHRTNAAPADRSTAQEGGAGTRAEAPHRSQRLTVAPLLLLLACAAIRSRVHALLLLLLLISYLRRGHAPDRSAVRSALSAALKGRAAIRAQRRAEHGGAQHGQHGRSRRGRHGGGRGSTGRRGGRGSHAGHAAAAPHARLLEAQKAVAWVHHRLLRMRLWRLLLLLLWRRHWQVAA